MTLLTYLFHICVCSCISVILYRQYLHSEYSFSSCRVMTGEYKLSCVLQGHSMDVKSVTVCCEPEGALLTASRDKTARLWYRGQPASPSEGGQSYSSRKVYRGHAKYVSTSRVQSSQSQNPVRSSPRASFTQAGRQHMDKSCCPTCISLGCQDSKIHAYLPDLEDPLFILEGHAENVVSLTLGKFGTLVSGILDTTGKVWVGESLHIVTVWAIGLFSSFLAGNLT